MLLAWPLKGVPVLEDKFLLGVSARGVPGLSSVSEQDDPRRSHCVVRLSLLLWCVRVFTAACASSEGSEESGEVGTGSARELCLTEFRL